MGDRSGVERAEAFVPLPILCRLPHATHPVTRRTRRAGRRGLRVGYSCWGFLGAGVVDTPDGGRSHRKVLLDGLVERGHELILLQRNRDLEEAGEDLTRAYCWAEDFPQIDALFLEWRWPIPPRNTSPCGAAGHTCDLHRQRELVRYYALDRAVPTLVWDKDLRLPRNSRLRRLANVQVLEAALRPSPGALTLRFPVSEAALERAWAGLDGLVGRDRPLTLVYVGNQYGRDEAFDLLFASAARTVPHAVVGKWPDRSRWPDLQFVGRVGFGAVDGWYRHALATVLLLPRRYEWTGQMTQRIFESVLAGCLPITPARSQWAEQWAPQDLHVVTGREVSGLLVRLREIEGGEAHRRLLVACFRRLAPFRLDRQLDVIDSALERLHDR